MYLFKNHLLFLLAALAPVYTLCSSTPLCPPQPATHEQQKAIFADFVQIFFVEKDVSKAFLTHVSEDYIQHNPTALSGRQNAIDGLTPLLPILNFTIEHRAFEGNIGWVHYRSDIPGRNLTAIVDLWRLDGTCIAEHWDVIQTLSGSAINPLAFFDTRKQTEEHDEL